MTIRRQLLAMGVLMIVGLQAEPAAARWCFWDGSNPFCEGRCPRDFVMTHRQACFSGYKVRCCEKLGSISQSQKRRR
jgi:hypothetical protein